MAIKKEHKPEVKAFVTNVLKDVDPSDQKSPHVTLEVFRAIEHSEKHLLEYERLAKSLGITHGTLNSNIGEMVKERISETVGKRQVVKSERVKDSNLITAYSVLMPPEPEN